MPLNFFSSKRAAVVAASVFFLGSTAWGQSLEARLRAMLNRNEVNDAAVGLHVVEVTTKGPVELFGHQTNLPLGPASNTKLLTTAAALETYGPKATFKTQLYKVGEDLLLVGGGDPALGDVTLAEARGEKITTPFEKFAAALKAAGVTSYRHLIIDDRVFDREFVHPNWPVDQLLSWYSAPIGGLNLNANCLDWRPIVNTNGRIGIELIPPTTYASVTIKATRGAKNEVWLWRPPTANRFEMRGTVARTATDAESVAIYEPGLWTGTVLRDVLNDSGITSTGEVHRIADDAVVTNATLVATAETKLLDVIHRANRNSVNMMTEGLCKRLGFDATRKPGTWASGTAAIEKYVRGLGIEAEQVSLDDGSGLSNKNRASARAFTTVLAHVAIQPGGDAFVDSLARPGEDGTLRRRFAGLPVAKAVHAKTGHIRGVSALSGYIDVPERPADGEPFKGRRFAFSILVNKYQGNVNPWQDAVCQEIFKWAGGK